MANDYFSFKQFTIHQDKSAMKVCTDACLFGAFIAQQLSEKEPHDNGQNEQQFLDIGAGTGLLSLMLAQKTTAQVTAVEMDRPAWEQAVENVHNSPWEHKIFLHHTTIQQFAPAHLFDFIISNPPFFQHDLKSSNNQRNLALHSEALTLTDLLTHVNRLLKPGGSFAVLLPYHRSQHFLQLALEHQLYLQQQLTVSQTEKHTAFRSILWLSNKHVQPVLRELTIKHGTAYTPAFSELLKDYYLYL